MHRGVLVALVFAAATTVTLTAITRKAGAAGVYENAAAEPAFLVSPRQVALRGDFEYSLGESSDAWIYRLSGVFPLRSAFMLAIEQPFLAVNNEDGLDTGIGDFWLRGSARLWRGSGRSFSLVGFMNTGSGTRRHFPYASQTLDVSASLGYVDSLGAATVFATVGNTWVNREKEGETDDARHTDNLRASAGTIVSPLDGASVRLGALFEDYRSGARRWILFAGGTIAATETLLVGADFQTEVGPEAQRVSDFALSLSATVRF